MKNNIGLIIIGIIIFLFVNIVLAGINIDEIWKSVLVEARGEGKVGMYAVACVFRNRLNANMNLGSSLKNKERIRVIIKEEDKQGELIAKEVVQEVFIDNGEDITFGATHFENIEQFGIPYWYYDMNKTCKIGNHTFFREKWRK